MGDNTYGYDANGNMTTRVVNGQSFTLTYDAENRLVSVSGAVTANFYYDADGKQVKAVVGGVVTYYVGNHYEVKGTTVTKYYFAGATRLAVRTGGTLSFILADHIGSASLTTDANGVTIGESLYKAFGESRFSVGTLNTDYQFTGQRVEASLGIYWFSSRWMDPSLGRFTQPDSIVPTSTQGTQAWDRYAFVNNNPVRYNDPTGHQAYQGEGGCAGYMDCDYGVYTAAGIGIQSQWPDPIIKDENSGRGPAQVSDKQMESPPGKEIDDGHHGVGLGLREPGSCVRPDNCPTDQDDPVTAWRAMQERIFESMKVCKNHGCSETDIFLVAALAENGSMLPSEVRTALKQNTASSTTTIDWNNFLQSDSKNGSRNVGLIISFAVNVQNLQKQGWSIPNVDWNYISSLTTGY